jgi:hypothetical protein
MVFGPGLSEEAVNTFEKAWAIVSSPQYIHADKKQEITDNLRKYLDKGGFEIPNEIG